MVSIFRRLMLLLILSLSAGFVVNQFYSEGIRWPLLKPRIYSEKSIDSLQFISADSAFALHLFGEATFIDVRPGEEYEIDHIPGAISIPLSDYYKSPGMLQRLNKEERYILYCFEPECREVNALAVELIHNQFNNISILRGGFSEWLEKGFPVE